MTDHSDHKTPWTADSLLRISNASHFRVSNCSSDRMRWVYNDEPRFAREWHWETQSHPGRDYFTVDGIEVADLQEAADRLNGVAPSAVGEEAVCPVTPSAQDVLRELEWSGQNASCPACGQFRWQATNPRHAPTCRLAAALREPEATEPAVPGASILTELPFVETRGPQKYVSSKFPTQVWEGTNEPDAEPTPITIPYTNWRGEFAMRTILPVSIFWGSNEWHPEPQWLIEVTDATSGLARTFALAGIGRPAADAERLTEALRLIRQWVPTADLDDVALADVRRADDLVSRSHVDKSLPKPKHSPPPEHPAKETPHA